MSVPVDLDKYQGWLALDENQLQEEHVPAQTIERVIRFRALYTYWCRFSSKLTDKEDTPDLAFDKIVPLEIVATDDPSVIGIKKIPDLRGRIKKFIKKYGAEAEFAEFIEIPATDNETAPSPGDIDDLIEKP